MEVDSSKQLIKMTDALRDVILPKYGVKIEDIEGANGSIWKLYEADVLLKMLAKDSSAKNAKIKKKLQNKEKQLEKDLTTWQMKAIAPSDYFQNVTDNDGNAMYSAFGDDGMPTHANGKPLSKKQVKKLPKALKKQEKAHQQYQAKLK